MSSLTLPEISTLPSLSWHSHSSILDTLFEPSPDLHNLAAPILANQTFSSYDALVETIGARLSALLATNSTRDRQVLEGILGSHPRLGESQIADREKLSELSRREQTSLNVGERGEAARKEAEELNLLNRAYEEKFVSLRYVVFVNGRGRDVIMQDMRRRIERGDINLEIEESIKAMCDIAADRARKLRA